MSAGGINARSARDLFDGGEPLPGKITRHTGGETIIAGFVAADLPFGRVVDFGVVQADNTRLFAKIDENTTRVLGISVNSFDAIAAQSECKYSAGEPVGVMNRGHVIMETAEDVDVNSPTLTIVNGETSGDEADVGKLANTTGSGFSLVNSGTLVVTRKISATLVEVYIIAGLGMAPG